MLLDVGSLNEKLWGCGYKDEITKKKINLLDKKNYKILILLWCLFVHKYFSKYK